MIAQRLLRPQDRLILCEAHPEDYQRLAACVGRDRRAKALEIDGYMALRAYAPPVERRGLALIDPPFETRDELARTRDNLCAAYKKFPTGVYALWRPLKEPPAIDAFDAALVREGIGKMLRLDLTVREIRPGEPLAGSSLLVVNPPFVLEAEARRLLPELSSLLSQGEGAGWRVGWVAA